MLRVAREKFYALARKQTRVSPKVGVGRGSMLRESLLRVFESVPRSWRGANGVAGVRLGESVSLAARDGWRVIVGGCCEVAV